MGDLNIFILSLIEWKNFVKMKMVSNLSLGIKAWETLFYLPGESDTRAMSMNFCGPYSLYDWGCV